MHSCIIFYDISWHILSLPVSAMLEKSLNGNRSSGHFRSVLFPLRATIFLFLTRGW
jgi:hypothetical protein